MRAASPESCIASAPAPHRPVSARPGPAQARKRPARPRTGP